MIANMWTAAYHLADSPIPHWLALLAITSLTIAGLYRLDRRLEQRRRTRDLAKYQAAVKNAANTNGWLDEDNELWMFPADEFRDERTPIADAIHFEYWEREWSA